MMLRHYKGEPNVYVIRYRAGQVQQHGQGLDFWYLAYNTSIAAIPALTQDAPFIFNEATANFQEVAIQGQLTYRLESPLDAAELLDFTVDPRTGRYRSKDPERLMQRVINAVQAHTRKGVNDLTLEQELTQGHSAKGQTGYRQEVLAQRPDEVAGVRTGQRHQRERCAAQHEPPHRDLGAAEAGELDEELAGGVTAHAREGGQIGEEHAAAP